jgi:hypothetical protein
MEALPNPFNEIKDVKPNTLARMPLFKTCEGCSTKEHCGEWKMCREPRHVTPLPPLVMTLRPMIRARAVIKPRKVTKSKRARK